MLQSKVHNEQAIFNTVSDIAKEYGAGFVNYNLLVEETGIDYSSDAIDAGHLNYRGNRKYTKELGKYIDRNFDVPDRRGEVAYKSWENEAKYLSASAANQELRETTDLQEVMKKLENPEYLLVISIDGNCTASDSRLARLFSAFKILNTEESGYWVADSTDGVLYASGTGNAETYLSLDSHDLCISRDYNENSKSYVNTVKLDNISYKKTDNGINILVYSKGTQDVADAFGLNATDSYQLVR